MLTLILKHIITFAFNENIKICLRKVEKVLIYLAREKERTRGICLDDNTIKGNRHEQRTGGERNKKWGGSRKRKLPMDSYGGDDIHVDANAGIQVKIEKGKKSLTKVLAEQARRLTESQTEVLEASTLSALGYEFDSSSGGESDELILVDRDAEDVEENISEAHL